jgi:hypothetical protein
MRSSPSSFLGSSPDTCSSPSSSGQRTRTCCVTCLTPRSLYEGYYVTFEISAGFLILMSALEITQIVWFTAIFRVAYLVITGQGTADTRSEEGDSDEEAEKES